jgi:hypothetical protein
MRGCGWVEEGRGGRSCCDEWRSDECTPHLEDREGVKEGRRTKEQRLEQVRGKWMRVKTMESSSQQRLVALL